MEWYYQTDEGPQGPIALEQLNAMLAEGALATDTPLRKEGREEWRPAWDLAELGILLPAEGADTAPTPEPLTTVDATESRAVFEALLKPLALIQLIIWGGFIYSQFAYGGLVWFLSQKEGVEPIELPGATIAMAAVGALIAGALGLLLRNKTFRDTEMQRFLREVEPSESHRLLRRRRNRAPSPAFLAKFASLSRADKRLYLLMKQVLRRRIFCFVLFEFVAIAGVLLGVESKDLSLALPFVVAALALTATVFPKTRALAARGRQML